MKKLLNTLNNFLERIFKKIINLLKRYRYLFFFIGIVFLFISPFLFSLNTLWRRFDFSNTGQIGDTIGGITSPFISLLGAVLVYLSFKEQIKANKIQFEYIKKEEKSKKKSNNFDSALRLIDEFNQDFQKLKYKEHSGIEAFIEYSKDFITENSNLIFKENIMLDNIINLLYLYDFLIGKINNDEFFDNDKHILSLKTLLIHKTKLSSSFKNLKSSIFDKEFSKYKTLDRLINDIENDVYFLRNSIITNNSY